MRIELIFLTWKVNVLPLDEGLCMGVLGLEPKTSGLRDHCSTDWAIQVGIIGLEPIIMGSKPTALPFGYIPAYNLLKGTENYEQHINNENKKSKV